MTATTTPFPPHLHHPNCKLQHQLKQQQHEHHHRHCQRSRQLGQQQQQRQQEQQRQHMRTNAAAATARAATTSRMHVNCVGSKDDDCRCLLALLAAEKAVSMQKQLLPEQLLLLQQQQKQQQDEEWQRNRQCIQQLVQLLKKLLGDVTKSKDANMPNDNNINNNDNNNNKNSSKNDNCMWRVNDDVAWIQGAIDDDDHRRTELARTNDNRLNANCFDDVHEDDDDNDEDDSIEKMFARRNQQLVMPIPENSFLNKMVPATASMSLPSTLPKSTLSLAATETMAWSSVSSTTTPTTRNNNRSSSKSSSNNSRSSNSNSNCSNNNSISNIMDDRNVGMPINLINTNDSQTTSKTLECNRCFKLHGDILSEQQVMMTTSTTQRDGDNDDDDDDYYDDYDDDQDYDVCNCDATKSESIAAAAAATTIPTTTTMIGRITLHSSRGRAAETIRTTAMNQSTTTTTTTATATTTLPTTKTSTAMAMATTTAATMTTTTTITMAIPLMLMVMLLLCWMRVQKLLLHTAKMSQRSYGLMAVLVLMLTTSTTVDCWAGRQDVMSNCSFPVRWEGSWFLSGYQQSIHIKGSQFSYRGKCAASDGNKYLIVDEKGCHRCLVIYEKHKNVLQYKESECEGDSMYMHQSNPSAMAMHSVLKQNLNGGEHRGGAHPNTNNNGHSRLSSSDQYIMRSNDDMNDYFCKGRETLQNLCDQIPGDALLYSLFRENAEPVKCPLKGPFIFTYNRGHGECKNPVSNIESCTEDSRLLLSFQACHDVQGTESTVEELTCLAAWKDGNSRYLVGLVSHHHAISNEERYRCFVYEKINSLMGGSSIISSSDAEYKLAQSGDATCNGLDSAEVGSRIMSLRKPPTTERCDFPVWFKGPRNWQALMGNAYYNYHSNDGSVHIFNSNGYMETRALCEQINKQTSTEMMAVVHYTTGCKSGFMCMMFYRRDTHVIEIQSGKQASRLEDACAPDHFDIHKTSYITLLASNPDPQICPLEGLYNLRGAIGPPYQATRHKRNHNNKAAHTGHGHHHQTDGFIGGTVGVGVGNNFAHKRHSTLRFRNADAPSEKDSWSANTRGLPVRNRRAAGSTTETPMVVTQEILIAHSAIDNGNNVASTSENTSTALTVTKQRRNRRNAPGCVTNYKAQRQLWVGCTEPNVIDVRPLCSEDGDEEYSCHGSWAENGTFYIIARHKGVNKHGVCISYRLTEGTAAKLVVGDACYRGLLKPPDHHLVANLSFFGKCGETGSASTQIQLTGGLVTLLTMALSTILFVHLHNILTLNQRHSFGGAIHLTKNVK